MSKPVQPIRPAATVIVVRSIIELRNFHVSAPVKRFASDMYVFPEGVDADDHLHKYDTYRHRQEAQAPQVKALGVVARLLDRGDPRTFEEAGLLLAYDQVAS